MGNFIEFWASNQGATWKRMIINTAHIVWFAEKDGKAVLCLSSTPNELVETDYPFAKLYEELTGEECLDSISR